MRDDHFNHHTDDVIAHDIRTLKGIMGKLNLKNTSLSRPTPTLLQRVLHDNIVEDVVDFVPGDVIVARLRAAIGCFSKDLTRDQVTFAGIFVQSLLPFIYGKHFKANEIRIKRDNLIDRIDQFCLIACPRRFGKTHIASTFCACALAAIPGINILVFSPSKRQSTDFLKFVRDRVVDLTHLYGFGIESYDAEDNQERFGVFVNGVKARITALPSKEDVSYRFCRRRRSLVLSLSPRARVHVADYPPRRMSTGPGGPPRIIRPQTRPLCSAIKRSYNSRALTMPFAGAFVKSAAP